MLIPVVALAWLLGSTEAAEILPKTLVYCSEGSPDNFGAQLATNGTTIDAQLPIYERLLSYQKGGTETVPALATSYEISADGRRYIFHLRHDVAFHSNAVFQPTRRMNADDVLFSFNRMLRADHPFHNVSGGDYEFFNDLEFPKLISAVEKLDDYTVRFTLTRPEAAFLADIALPQMPILSAEYGAMLLAKATPERIDQDPIGTGPYYLKHYQKDALVRYLAFQDYWQGKPKLDQLVFSITPDAAVRAAKLLGNECQIMSYPHPADLQRLKGNKALRLATQTGLNAGYIVFNVGQKPLDQLQIRRALTLAINKRAILDAVFQGSGEVAINPIPPPMWSYDKTIVDYPYDPDAAKKLLVAAGYPDGFTTELWAIPVQRPYNPNGRRMAELIQADWAKIGVTVNIVSFEWGEYLKRLTNGEAPISQYGWSSDNGDPDNFFSLLYGCDGTVAHRNNVGRWCDPQMVSLLNAARLTSDRAARTLLYQQAQQVFHDAIPAVPIAYGVITVPIRTSVLNYIASPFDYHEFDGVDLAP